MIHVLNKKCERHLFKRHWMALRDIHCEDELLDPCGNAQAIIYRIDDVAYYPIKNQQLVHLRAFK